MMWERDSLYRRALRNLVGRGVLHENMSVLVAAAGAPDRDALQSLRFSNVTMTNISREPPADLSPYHYETQDLEALQYDDLSFDWALVSASLHHCRSPHRALLELYRVARRGVLALESRDSLAI